VRILLDTDTNYRAYPLPQLTSCSATRGSKRKKEKKVKERKAAPIDMRPCEKNGYDIFMPVRRCAD